jgi:hypothetical protein
VGLQTNSTQLWFHVLTFIFKFIFPLLCSLLLFFIDDDDILESWIDQTMRLFGFLFEDMSLRSNSDLSEDFGLFQQLQERGYAECSSSCVRWEMNGKDGDSSDMMPSVPLTAKKRRRFKDSRDAFIALDAWKYDVATTLTQDGSILGLLSLHKEESLSQTRFEKLALFLGCIFRCISMPFFHEGDDHAIGSDVGIKERPITAKEKEGEGEGEGEEDHCSDRMRPH